MARFNKTAWLKFPASDSMKVRVIEIPQEHLIPTTLENEQAFEAAIIAARTVEERHFQEHFPRVEKSFVVEAETNLEALV
jgi:hypothetical protein